MQVATVEVYMPDEINANESVRYPAGPGIILTQIFGRISWGAVWAGVMIALAYGSIVHSIRLIYRFRDVQLQGCQPWAGISVWTTVWYLVTARWSMFFGAWCAARLSGNPARGGGILHGITTWGLTAFVTMVIVVVASWTALRAGVDVLSTAEITRQAGSTV